MIREAKLNNDLGNRPSVVVILSYFLSILYDSKFQIKLFYKTQQLWLLIARLPKTPYLIFLSVKYGVLFLWHIYMDKSKEPIRSSREVRIYSSYKLFILKLFFSEQAETSSSVIIHFCFQLYDLCIKLLYSVLDIIYFRF